MNKKGFATSTIVFALLSVFLISISILLVTITNTNRTKNALNEKVVSNIEYGNSSINDIEQRLEELENNTLKIDDIYPVGSVYISTTDDTIEKVQNRFGGAWEKYSEGRTIIGDGTTTDESGNALVYNANQIGGNTSKNITLSVNNLPAHTHTYSKSNTVTGSHTLTVSEMPSHEHSIYTPSGHTWASGYSYENNTYKDTYVNFVVIPDAVNDKKYYGDRPMYAAATGGSKGHKHNITLTTTNTSSVGKGEALNLDIQNPYIVTYIYKRVK